MIPTLNPIVTINVSNKIELETGLAGAVNPSFLLRICLLIYRIAITCKVAFASLYPMLMEFTKKITRHLMSIQMPDY